MKRQPPPGLRRIIALGAILLVLASVGRADQAGDEAALRELNGAYAKAFLAHDVAFFQSLLTDDFIAVLADGRMIDRAGFLVQAAVPPPIHSFEVHDVVIHAYGDSAVVSAWVTYKRSDETLTRTRYIDLYVREGGRWRMASIQWTRVASQSR